MKSREVETSKQGECDEETAEGRKKRQEDLSAVDSLFVFIFYTYFAVVLLLFIWLPLRQVGDSRPACGGGSLKESNLTAPA